jgi:hypothetical protein
MRAEQLDMSQGGIYSNLASDMQPFVIRQNLSRLRKKNQIPSFGLDDDVGAVQPRIVTGMEAVGRASEIQRMHVWLDVMAKAASNPAVLSVAHMRELSGASALAAGLDSAPWMKTREEIEQERIAAQQAAIEQASAPETVRQMGGLIRRRVDVSTQQPA